MGCMQKFGATYPQRRVVVVGHGDLATAALPAPCPEMDMLAVLATKQHDGSISQILLLAEPKQDLETVQIQRHGGFCHLAIGPAREEV